MSEQTATAVADAPPVRDPQELALIDLSSISFPLFLTSASEPDPNAASTKIVDRIRALTSQHKHAAICCDSGRSFRADIDPAYKAQREAQPAAYHHQVALAKERLEADGYPVWAVKGFEADDLIATATARALAMDGSVLIVSADKDLLQLVGPKVRALSPATNKDYDEAAVVAKFGVQPSQMRDYLALVGDASDNIVGAKGIGPKKAANLLLRFDSIANLLAEMKGADLHGPPSIVTPSEFVSLAEFKDRAETVCRLITLRFDVELPFEEVAAERAPRNQAPMEDEEMEALETPTTAIVGEVLPPLAAPVPQNGPAPVAVTSSGPVVATQAAAPPAAPPVSMGQALASPEAVGLAPVEFEKQLEPRSLGQAGKLAEYMHRAAMFKGYGNAPAVLSTILAGRELGMQAIASLRGFHVIEGKHSLAADAMRGLVLRSGAAKYFRVVERTIERATFETWRKDDPESIRLTYTIEEARAAYGFGTDANEKALNEREAKWRASSWGKQAADMLAARASSKLARLVYADILFGLYSPAELSDHEAA
jgi:5'-3' exonuclease